MCVYVCVCVCVQECIRESTQLHTVVYNRKREGEYPTPYTAVQTH